jgi:hypothetical protein
MEGMASNILQNNSDRFSLFMINRPIVELPNRPQNTAKGASRFDPPRLLDSAAGYHAWLCSTDAITANVSGSRIIFIGFRQARTPAEAGMATIPMRHGSGQLHLD